MVRASDGSSIWNEIFAPLQLISDVNNFFDNGMRFVLCGVNYVDSDEWYILNTVAPPNTPPTFPPPISEWKALQAYVDNLNSAIPKGYIDIFIVGGFHQNLSGIAARPQSVSSRGSVACQYRAETVAHELGHYFGLAHTFSGGPFAGTPPQFAQYVDDPVIINQESFTGWETGDFIPDTPADPGSSYCNESSACGLISNCVVADPHGKTYAPDPTLLMSYYSGCYYRFSSNQSGFVA